MSAPLATVYCQGDPKTLLRRPKITRIVQKEFAHDVAVLTMQFANKIPSSYRGGKAVTIQWGWLPNDVEFFHGYINHIKRIDTHTKLKTVEVYCIGASYKMKDIKLRSFKKKQAHQVALQIAKEHHLSITLEHSAFVHDHLTQGARSDWDFLVWLAKRVGYTFYCTKTDIVFTKRVIDKNPGKDRPTFLFHPSKWFQRNSCYEVHQESGETVPGTAKRIRQVWGVDNQGRVLKTTNRGVLAHLGGTYATTDPIFSAQLARPVSSLVQAKQALEAKAEEHRFNTIGTAVLSGNTKVHQGTTIRLTGVAPDSNGFWYVTEVDHIVTATDYRLTVAIGRDSTGDAALTTPVVLSDAGKPVLLTDCDITVDKEMTPASPTIYNPVDDCAPVETVSEQLLGPDPAVPVGARSSAARVGVYARKPIPTRRRGIPVAAHPHTSARPTKVTAWRAAATSVRTVRR